MSLGQFTWGDLIAFLGFVFAIITFWCQMNKNRSQSRSSQKETWYLEIILKPNLEKINKFYNKFIQDVSNSVCTMQSNESTITVSELKLKKQQNNTILFDKIGVGLDHIVAIVRSYDKSLGKRVGDVENELEDLATKIITNYEKYDQRAIRKDILMHKQTLISTLYEGISIKDERS